MVQVDDDAYVRVERLLKRLEAAPQQRMFMGAIEDPGGGPNREVGHQWYVSEEDWPADTYPPWAHGVGYVLTQDLVREIAAGNSLHTPPSPPPPPFPLKTHQPCSGAVMSAHQRQHPACACRLIYSHTMP